MQSVCLRRLHNENADVIPGGDFDVFVFLITKGSQGILDTSPVKLLTQENILKCLSGFYGFYIFVIFEYSYIYFVNVAQLNLLTSTVRKINRKPVTISVIELRWYSITRVVQNFNFREFQDNFKKFNVISGINCVPKFWYFFHFWLSSWSKKGVEKRIFKSRFHFCFLHAVTSSVIYYNTYTRKNVILLLKSRFEQT